MIRLQQLSVQYGRRTILHPMDLELNAGELVVIVGRNGAGKSTLLKAIAGDLITQSSGAIRFHNRLIKDWSIGELAKYKGQLAQANSMAFALTVREIVQMGRYPFRQEEDIATQRRWVDQALRLCEIEQFAERNIQSLSGGEQQRVHFARVLGQVSWSSTDQARMLLLDEPLNNLDITWQLKMMELARKFTDSGHLCLCILHDLNIAAAFADRIILLHDGHCHGFGAPSEVLEATRLEAIYEVPVQVASIPNRDYPAILMGPKKSASTFSNFQNQRHALLP
ncbi:MAG: heme ABC transporter ATP-binding protein [Bacteroidota bacterium]